MDPPTAKFDEKEHLHRLTPEDFSANEITRQQLLLVVIEEGSPFQALLLLR
jgi:hypothetical protein